VPEAASCTSVASTAEITTVECVMMPSSRLSSSEDVEKFSLPTNAVAADDGQSAQMALACT